MEPQDNKHPNNQDEPEQQQNDNNNEMQEEGEEQQIQGQQNQEQQQGVSGNVDEQAEMQDQHNEEQQKQGGEGEGEDQQQEQNDEQQEQANNQKKSQINQLQNQIQQNIQQIQQKNIKKPEDIIQQPKEQIIQNKNKEQKINKANQLQEKLNKLKQKQQKQKQKQKQMQKQKKQAQPQAQVQNKQNKQQIKPIVNQQQNTPPQVHKQQQSIPVQSIPQPSPSSPNIQHPTSQPPSQKYLNHLELQLFNSQKTLSQTISKLNSQTNLTSAMTSNNKLLSSTLTHKNKQNANLQQQIRHKTQQISHKDRIIQQLKQQLSLYRQIGDVKGLKIRVQQLQSLVQLLKKQIQIKNLHKNQMIQERQKNQDQDQHQNQDQEYNKINKLVLRDLITKFQNTQNQKQNFQARVIQLQYLISLKDKQLTQNLQIMNKIDQQLKLSMQKCTNLQSQLQSLTTTYISQKSTLLQKLTNLQSSFHNIKSKSYQSHTNNQQKQKQKDILFRQYLKIQLQYKEQQDQLKQIKMKYQQVCKDMRIVKKQMVSRKDYEEVFARYRKCKQCLQKVIGDNKKLSRRQIQSQDMIQQKNININNLNQQQNNTKKYLQVFNHHVQQSINYFKQTNQLLENNQFQKLTTDIKSAQLLISELISKNTRLQKLNTIFQNQLVYKNSLLDRIIADSKNVKQYYYRLQEEKLNIQEDYVENVSAKSALRRLETKAAGLLLRNRKILEQKQQWKSLYENIKQKYENFISRDPNFQQQHQEQRLQEDKKASQNQIKQGQMQAQSPKTIPKPSLSTTQTQTQGLNQLYYKQIKQTLSAVKKFPQSIKSATKNFQNISLQLQEYKKRYDQVNQKYNIKFRTLQNQKNQNDSWRQTTRKQIVNQFQQIRQLIEDGRLLTCLRKAKNLIEYFEQAGEEEGQVVAE